MGGPCPGSAAEVRQPSLQNWSQTPSNTRPGPPKPQGKQPRPTLKQLIPELPEQKRPRRPLIEELDSIVHGCEERLGQRVDQQTNALVAVLIQHSQRIEASLVHTLERQLNPTRSASQAISLHSYGEPSRSESDPWAYSQAPAKGKDVSPLDTQTATTAPPEPLAEIESRPRPRLNRGNTTLGDNQVEIVEITPNQTQDDVEEVEEVEDWDMRTGRTSARTAGRRSLFSSAGADGNDWLMNKMSDLDQFVKKHSESHPKVRMRRLHAAGKQVDKRRCVKMEKVVEGTWFNLFWDMLIIVNALTIGANAHMSVRNALGGDPEPEWVETVEMVFSLLFVTEMLIRVVVLRLRFFLGPNWKWNVFDFLVVITSATQDITGLIDDWSRLFRSFRAVRVLRAVRGQRILVSLRLMIGCMLHSMETLIWAIVLLILILYFFTVVFLQGASSWLSRDIDFSTPLNVETKSAVAKHFGTFPTAMLSLFMAVTGGADWEILMDCTWTVGPAYGACFLFYVFFMIFGLFNILVGVFVDRAFESSNMDQDIVIKAEQDRIHAFMREVQEMFVEIDVEEIGSVTLEQFIACQSDRRMMSFMQANYLNLINPTRFFKMLDRDDSGCITLGELIMGLMRLGGQARSADLMMLASDTGMMRKELSTLVTRTDTSLDIISRYLGLSLEPSSAKDCLD